MNTHYLTRARKHFNCGISTIDRHNQLSWVRSLRVLGDRWLLAKPITRSTV